MTLVLDVIKPDTPISTLSPVKEFGCPSDTFKLYKRPKESKDTPSPESSIGS